MTTGQVFLLNWAAVLVLGLVAKRVAENLYAVARADRDDMRRFTDRAIEAMNRVANGCDTCHADMVEAIKKTTAGSRDSVLDAVSTMHTDANVATSNILLALGKRERGLVESVGGLLRDLRGDLEKMRAAPVPVGGVGSQVRDGGAP